MPAVTLKAIHKRRLRNLNELIEKRFDGNASALARAIDRSHTFMWQLLKQYRSIGEETARHIEKQLKLGVGGLDMTSERTTELKARMGDGSTTLYVMAPHLLLDAFTDKPRSFSPCPDHRAGPKTFCVQIVSEAIMELHEHDLAFVDPDKSELQSGKLYVVTMKGKPAVARVMMAKKVSTTDFVFVVTDEHAKAHAKPIDAAQVNVAGRVILVVRHLR